jgi:hypothetical protein
MRILHPICIAALGLSACSIHPIPFDVPGYRTVDIVRKIRCEAAKAIDLHVVQAFNSKSDKKTLEQYLRTAIVYRFTFTITESNNAGAAAGFKLPLTHGTFTLGLGGGAERERSGTRDLTVTDTFGETLEEIYEVGPDSVKGADGKMRPVLHLEREPKACAQEAKGENWIHPITGRIGLDESIRTFVGLSRLQLLDDKGKELDLPMEAPKTPPAKPMSKAPLKKMAPVARIPSSLLIVNEKLAVRLKLAPTLYAGRRDLKKDKRRDRDGAGDRDRAKPEGEGKTKGFSDELEFVTTFRANANPKIELKPVGSGLRLTEAEATVAGERVDKHKVIITITPSKKGESAKDTVARAENDSKTTSQVSDMRNLAKAFSKR